MSSFCLQKLSDFWPYLKQCYGTCLRDFLVLSPHTFLHRKNVDSQHASYESRDVISKIKTASYKLAYVSCELRAAH